MGLMGQRFGRLLVESAAEPYISPKKQTKHRRWNCLCDCGNSKVIRESSLTGGYSNSCGCLATEVAGKASITHGFSNNQLYSVWYGMHKRCYNAKAKAVYTHESNIYTAAGRYLRTNSNGVERARNWEAGLRYERALSEHFGVFVGQKAESDVFNGYIQRDSTDAGLKYTILKV